MNKPLKIPEDIVLKRLHYRSWHRGCKETDLILGRFADEGLSKLDKSLLPLYEQFLDENDVDIWNWISGKEIPENPAYRDLIDLLKDYGIPVT